jgi:integrase
LTIYDKNQKRIRELQNKVKAGKVPEAKADARIAKLQARPPEWWAKGRAFGKWYDVPCRVKTRKAAEDFDARIRLQVQDKTYTPADLLNIRLREMFTAHLDAQKGKGGYKAAKTRHGHACRILGHVRLSKLHDNPREILERAFDSLPVGWVQKTRWHVWSFMSAAFGRYKRAYPKLTINNPFTAFEISHGTNDRTVFPTEAEHLQVVSHLQANPLRWQTREGKGPVKVGFPAYLPVLMVVKYEQGLRGGEIIAWRLEKMDLDCLHGKYPAILTKILKKGKRQWQWVVLTPTAYRAIRAYLQTLPGPKEVGPLWPVKNWPTELVRRALDECNLQHLWAHDWRRSWTMNHIDAEGTRRRAAIGKQTESGEAPYIHFNRAEQEELYAPKWAAADGENNFRIPNTTNN